MVKRIAWWTRQSAPRSSGASSLSSHSSCRTAWVGGTSSWLSYWAPSWATSARRASSWLGCSCRSCSAASSGLPQCWRREAAARCRFPSAPSLPSGAWRRSSWARSYSTPISARSDSTEALGSDAAGAVAIQRARPLHRLQTALLPLLRCQVHQHAHELREVGRRERLGQVGVGPEGQCFESIRRRPPSGEHDYGGALDFAPASFI